MKSSRSTSQRSTTLADAPCRGCPGHRYRHRFADLARRPARPVELDRQLLGQISLVTFVTLGEALTGAHSGGWNPRRSSGLRAFYEHAFTLLEWDDAIPYTYARLRGQAAFSGHTVPANDCWIVACCVTHDLPLMTRNRKHFEPLEPLGLDLL